MSADERLAAVVANVVRGIDVLASDPTGVHVIADPTLLADIEDGAALRRLAAVVPDGWEAVARFGGWHKWPMVEVWDPSYPPSRDDPEQPRYISCDATIAAAADACRVALEEVR